MIKLDNDLFKVITGILYKKSGIKIEITRREWLEKKIERRLEELELLDINKYINKLMNDIRDDEIKYFLDLLTINETYFFRNIPQLDIFKNITISDLINRKKNKSINIWSAGCSVGCEPYTLGIILKESIPDFESWNIKIDATDISLKSLDKAKKGEYNKREVQYVPPDLLQMYFDVRQDKYYISDDIKKLVSFKYSNLNKTVDNLNQGIYDVIFCRNVLIYFETDIQKKIVNMFYDHLTAPGYIFPGHSESLSRLSRLYVLKKIDGKLLYMKEN